MKGQFGIQLYNFQNLSFKIVSPRCTEMHGIQIPRQYFYFLKSKLALGDGNEESFMSWTFVGWMLFKWWLQWRHKLVHLYISLIPPKTPCTPTNASNNDYCDIQSKTPCIEIFNITRHLAPINQLMLFSLQIWCFHVSLSWIKNLAW